jgi:hypothetical protein
VASAGTRRPPVHDHERRTDPAAGAPHAVGDRREAAFVDVHARVRITKGVLAARERLSERRRLSLQLDGVAEQMLQRFHAHPHGIGRRDA